ncbi:hypothetical protein LOD99_12128 [Oopsacas minuta]|uniref:V(D)J recombination-activating protein 1 RNase H domain-containing protein n=1 Tax=Oopsacas minuta TaxID=111878 RepID=A0AAV7JIM9_9METZ|nr:hypothetical protein LOD99_12128 [Oopsacas minuta]
MIFKKRASFHKYSGLDTWNSICFCPLPKEPRLSASSSLTINFEEDFNLSKKKSLADLTTKGLRNRLSSLKSHLESVAENEHVTPKTLATYLLLLCCNEEQDMNSANVCKEILEKGNSSPIYPQLSLDKSAFLFDSLEIGKTKYLELRRTLLSEDLKLPGYIVEFPCRVGISYTRLLTHTVERIVSNLSPDTLVYPLKVRVSDGLDGSGCHRVYQQAISNPDLSTKTFILFGFKVNSIINANDHILWKPHHPNSPFCTRPVALLALPENEESVKFLMDSLINNETSTIEESGLCLHNGNAEVKIIRSHFDTKMAKILSGAGGANCQMCTATFQQIHDISIVQNGFPINRTIRDARDVFDEVDEEVFLSLPTNQRFNLTHKPISEKDIISASPLHAY